MPKASQKLKANSKMTTKLGDRKNQRRFTPEEPDPPESDLNPVDQVDYQQVKFEEYRDFLLSGWYQIFEGVKNTSTDQIHSAIENAIKN